MYGYFTSPRLHPVPFTANSRFVCHGFDVLYHPRNPMTICTPLHRITSMTCFSPCTSFVLIDLCSAIPVRRHPHSHDPYDGSPYICSILFTMTPISDFRRCLCCEFFPPALLFRIRTSFHFRSSSPLRRISAFSSNVISLLKLV